jgi:hypothetical protein
MSLKRSLSPLLSVYRLALRSGKEYRAPKGRQAAPVVAQARQSGRIPAEIGGGAMIVNHLAGRPP